MKVTVGDRVRIDAPGSGADGIIGEIVEDYREDGGTGVLVTYGPGQDIAVGVECLRPVRGYMILTADGTPLERVYNTTTEAAQAVYALDPGLRLGYRIV